MTTLQVWILIAVVAIVFTIAYFVINWQYNKEERENSLVKWILLFDKKTKQFSEQRNDEFEEKENIEVIGITTNSILHSFNRFLSRESYHVTTAYQAHKVYEIYLASRECKLEGHAN